MIGKRQGETDRDRKAEGEIERERGRERQRERDNIVQSCVYWFTQMPTTAKIDYNTEGVD